MEVRDFLREGNHSWDALIEYFQCPRCERIIEDRQQYEDRHGRQEKEVHCHSCGRAFTVARDRNE